MGDIFIQMIDMPSGMCGHVNPNPDGTYTIMINARLSYEEQMKTYEHEMRHINKCDFEKYDVDMIEYENHKEVY